jgi:2-polyprenyl-3-methyl-5-hydroxy-6-metoxy-1,4-benzoquinol methylase
MTDNILDEHFVPSHGLDLQGYIRAGDTTGVHHVIRYVWAIECLADMPAVTTVLDIACGAGYGSHAIAERFPHIRVVGCDYDANAVEGARRSYALPNLEYRAGDGTRWSESIGNEVFDCIISFDTLEHVSHREILMANLVRHLAPDGALLFSTPSGHPRVVLEPEWSYHKIEYSPGTLFDFMSRYFELICRPEAGTLPNADVFDRLEGSGVSYLMLMNPLLCRGPRRIENPFQE